MASFDDLNGILKNRKSIITENSSLLVSFAVAMAEKYSRDLDNQMPAQLYETYRRMSAEVACSKLRNQKVSSADLEAFIYTFSDKRLKEGESHALGMFSTSILDLIMLFGDKSRDFYFNGSGKNFENLFMFASGFEKLVLESFSGNQVAGFASSFGQKSGTLFLKDISGDFVGRNIGSYKGSIENIIFMNNQGYKGLASAGIKDGHISNVLALSNRGEGLCFALSSLRGSCGRLVMANNEGELNGHGIGVNGFIDEIYLSGNKGKDFLRKIVRPANVKRIYCYKQDNASFIDDYKMAEIIHIVAGDESKEELIKFFKCIKDQDYESIRDFQSGIIKMLDNLSTKEGR